MSNNIFSSSEERKRFTKAYLGRLVRIEIDRPIGYIHQKGEKRLVYPINYGYIPHVLGGDGEELDVYLLGVREAVTEYTVRIIGIVWREDDVEDKLVGVPDGMHFTAEEISAQVAFQEQYHVSHVEIL